MKTGLLVVVTLLIASLVVAFAFEDTGYVVINFRNWVIEMSLIMLIGVLLSLAFFGWAILKIVQSPRKLGKAYGRYKSDRAGARLTQGMIQIAEGNFARGEKLLVRAAGVSDAPLLNYLQAARAAHLLGQDQRRDDWLKLAYEETPEAANAVLLTQAEFQIDQEQYESALATLRRIEEDAPDHARAVSLLGRLYFRLEDWPNLHALLPRLRKHGRLDGDVLDEWSIRVHEAELAVATDEADVEKRWSEVTRDLRQRERPLIAYYEALVRVGAHAAAEKGIRGVLKRRWVTPLVELFGRIEGSDPQKQLKQVEDWLAQHPEDPALLLAAARLCIAQELWGKARSYLESVLGLAPSADAYQEYGRLLNQLGETDAAAEAFLKGLGLLSGSSTAALPHLGPETSEGSNQGAAS